MSVYNYNDLIIKQSSSSATNCATTLYLEKKWAPPAWDLMHSLPCLIPNLFDCRGVVSQKNLPVTHIVLCPIYPEEACQTLLFHMSMSELSSIKPTISFSQDVCCHAMEMVSRQWSKKVSALVPAVWESLLANMQPCIYIGHLLHVCICTPLPLTCSYPIYSVQWGNDVVGLLITHSIKHTNLLLLQS